MEAFVEAFNQLIQNKASYINKVQKHIESLIDPSVLGEQLESKETEYYEAYKELKALVESNSTRLQNQNEYADRFNEVEQRYLIIEKEISDFNAKIAATKAQREKISIYLKNLKTENKLINEFSEDLWYAFVDRVTVYTDNKLIFKFKDGSDIGVSFVKKVEK